MLILNKYTHILSIGMHFTFPPLMQQMRLHHIQHQDMMQFFKWPLRDRNAHLQRPSRWCFIFELINEVLETSTTKQEYNSNKWISFQIILIVYKNWKNDFLLNWVITALLGSNIFHSSSVWLMSFLARGNIFVLCRKETRTFSLVEMPRKLSVFQEFQNWLIFN